MNLNHLDTLIDLALREDIGEGDHSALACIDPNIRQRGEIFAKESGVVYGLALAQRIFEKVDSELTITAHKKDGDSIEKGDVVLVIEGNARSILSGERLALNFLQRLSGVSTTTRLYVDQCGGRCQLLDTRKTTPGFRQLEKEAVLAGGGTNHRMGLYDMIMLKDNHIDYAGGIAQAIERCHAYIKQLETPLKIEVEVRDFKELHEVLEVGGIDRIMLDNFSVPDLTKAIQLIDGRFETEASGGINLETIGEVSKTGVNYISVGALTHSIKSLDFSLLVHAEI